MTLFSSFSKQILLINVKYIDNVTFDTLKSRGYGVMGLYDYESKYDTNMKKTGIIYGSTTGTTKAVAHRIGKILEVDDNDILDVATIAPSKLADYDLLLLGTSTWGAGDLQEDWYDFIDGAAALDLNDKTIAIFGCGDETMTDTFCSAVGTLYEKFKPTGAKMIGAFDADGYTFNHSAAFIDGQYVGLLLDEVNHPEFSDLRIRRWTSQLNDELK